MATLVVKKIWDEKANAFMKELVCPECGDRVRFNGMGQAGIHRVICYLCEPCDIFYQLLIEKKGVGMFEEAEGECTLVADRSQNKCNVCACGLYSGPETLM